MKIIHSISLPCLLTSALLLASCAGKVTKEDCQEANFYEMGLEDGKDGKTAERLEKYRSVCDAGQMSTLEERYNYGRRVGLVEHCDAKKARDDVKDGEVDSVCQQAAVPPYETAYMAELSERKNELQEQWNKLEEDKKEIQKRQDELQSQIDKANQAEGAL